jgi:hypothetical protein
VELGLISAPPAPPCETSWARPPGRPAKAGTLRTLGTLGTLGTPAKSACAQSRLSQWSQESYPPHLHRRRAGLWCRSRRTPPAPVDRSPRGAAESAEKTSGRHPPLGTPSPSSACAIPPMVSHEATKWIRCFHTVLKRVAWEISMKAVSSHRHSRDFGCRRSHSKTSSTLALMMALRPIFMPSKNDLTVFAWGRGGGGVPGRRFTRRCGVRGGHRLRRPVLCGGALRVVQPRSLEFGTNMFFGGRVRPGGTEWQ